MQHRGGEKGIAEVVGFDWNCPKHITQRFTREEVEEAMQPLKKRIEELEATRMRDDE